MPSLSRSIKALALAAAALASPAQADGDSASVTGMAHASVVEPLTVRQIDPLQFGTLAVRQGQSGAIKVDPATGAVSYSGALGNACPSSSVCAASPALFLVSGEEGRTYRIEAPASVTAFHTNTGTGLPVSDIAVAVENATGEAMRGVLGELGQDRFRVGGTLQVAQGSPVGTYRADLQMVVFYD